MLTINKITLELKIRDMIMMTKITRELKCFRDTIIEIN